MLCLLRILHNIFDNGKKNKIDYKARGVKWKNYALTDFLNIQGYGWYIDLIFIFFSRPLRRRAHKIIFW